MVYGEDTLIDLTADTVTADSMLAGTTAHSGSGAPVTGTIPSMGTNDVTVSGLQVTVPSGFYRSAVVKTAIGPTTYEYEVTTGSIGSATELNEITASEITGWDEGTLPTLGTDITADDIINWDRGTAATASVANGILTITNGTRPDLTYQPRSIPNVTNVGTLPSLSYDDHDFTPVTVTPTTVVTDISEASDDNP